jgi:hypothetical protein
LPPSPRQAGSGPWDRVTDVRPVGLAASGRSADLRVSSSSRSAGWRPGRSPAQPRRRPWSAPLAPKKGSPLTNRSMAKWLPDHHILRVIFDSGLYSAALAAAARQRSQASPIRSAVAPVRTGGAGVMRAARSRASNQGMPGLAASRTTASSRERSDRRPGGSGADREQLAGLGDTGSSEGYRPRGRRKHDRGAGPSGDQS